MITSLLENAEVLESQISYDLFFIISSASPTVSEEASKSMSISPVVEYSSLTLTSEAFTPKLLTIVSIMSSMSELFKLLVTAFSSVTVAIEVGNSKFGAADGTVVVGNSQIIECVHFKN